MTVRIPTLFLFIAFLLPATAAAQDCLPGRAALDQYCQAVPDGEGGSADGAAEPDRTVRDSAPSSTTRQLADAGEDGDVLLGLPSTEGADRGAAETTGGSSASSGDAGDPGTKRPSSSTGAEGATTGGRDESGGTTENDGEVAGTQVSPGGPPSSDLVASNAATRIDPAWLIGLGVGCIALIAGLSYFRRQERRSE